jgi:hypothetical protein
LHHPPPASIDPARTGSAGRIRETSLACDRVELPEYVVWSTVAHKGVDAGVALGRERRLAYRALEMGLAYYWRDIGAKYTKEVLQRRIHLIVWLSKLARYPPRDEETSAYTTPPSNPTIMHLCMRWLIKKAPGRFSPRGVSSGAGR